MQNAVYDPKKQYSCRQMRQLRQMQDQAAFLTKKLEGYKAGKNSNLVQPWATGFPASSTFKPQEPEPELVDDTTPNVTKPTSRPVGGKSAPAKSAAESQPQELSKRAQKFQIFKAKLEKKLEEKKAALQEQVKHAFSWANPQPQKQKPEEVKNDEASQGKEIHWELNKIDENQRLNEQGTSQQQPQPALKPPEKPEVIKGLASDIKLVVQQKQKSTVVPKPAVPKPENPMSSGNSNAATGMPKEHNMLGSTPSTLYRPYGRVRQVEVSGRPAGVPMSFLVQQQNIGAITPQSSEAQNPKPSWAVSAQLMHQQPQPTHPDTPVHCLTNIPETDHPQPYSPSEGYDITSHEKDDREGSESPDGQTAQKRLSAFQRLGPLTQPKKPKLTINLLCNKDQSVREVLDETDIEDRFAPVHHREDIKNSKDETVLKYLPQWPWKRPVGVRKSVTARNSKSVMLLELEQMEEAYDKDTMFIQVSVRGYPPFWKKEHVLDVILDAVKGKSFIPCFIEFTPQECKFLVIRSRSALATIHKLGFYIRKEDVELGVTILQVDIGLKQIDFIPRLVLRKRLAQGYDGERKLTLSEFTTKYDVSHFIYFPLNRVTNQTELVQLQSAVVWDYLTDLDLSHNRITALEGFNLPSLTPKLKHLDISHNYIDKISAILRCRDLPLRSLKVEGNPLCHHYIDPGHYVKVFKMIFPGLTELDGVPIQLRGEFPSFKRNYCPSDAKDVVDKFLEVYFPLLDAPLEDRHSISNLYAENATMSITFRYKLRYSPVYRYFRPLFLRARIFDEGEVDPIDGAEEIGKVITKWPPLLHDPHTFSVDVMHHSETSTIVRVNGLLKLTAESLAEDEHILHFTRTLVLTTRTGAEYKILNELLYWDGASQQCVDKAFQMNSLKSMPLSLKLESTPDDDLKEKLLEIFMKITDLDKKASERCLEMKEWHLRNALEYFKFIVTQDKMSSLLKS